MVTSPRNKFPARAIHTPPFRTRGMTGNRLFTARRREGGAYGKAKGLDSDGGFPQRHYTKSDIKCQSLQILTYQMLGCKIHVRESFLLCGRLSIFLRGEIKKGRNGISPRLPSMGTMFVYNIVVAFNSALISEHCYVCAPDLYGFAGLKWRCMMIVLLNQNNQTTTSDFPRDLHLPVTGVYRFNERIDHG